MSTRLMQLVLALALLSVMGWSSARANGAQALSLPWFTFGSGGQIVAIAGASDGEYSLSGTLGQPDASTHVQGDRFALSSGFWGQLDQSPTGQSKDTLFLPVIRVTK